VSRRELSEKAVSLRQNAAKRARLKRDGLSEFDSIIAGYRERLRELPASDEEARRVLEGFVHIKQVQRGCDELEAQMYEKLANGGSVP
jgi:hypothetical protein